MSRITVAIADDHTLVRDGTRQILEREPDIEVVGEAGTGDEAVLLAARLRPAVLVMDLRMPGLNGIEATQRICAGGQSTTRVLVVSAYEDDEYVAAALRAGAAGYLPKTTPAARLVAAVRQAHAGQVVLDAQMTTSLARALRAPSPATRLSSRELEVVRLVAGGLRNKEIAHQLAISQRTVEGHLQSIFSKLGVASRTEVIRAAAGMRLVDLTAVP
jgi:DNA-binding NarL/FixJ family response regulator